MRNNNLTAGAILLLAAAWLGCSAGGPAGTSVTSVDGGTAPPDGASGVCCPVSTGGCANPGGYSSDGNSCEPQLCDGMCNQRIVAGDHGCPTLKYDPCDTFGGGSRDGGGDGGYANDACSYPPVANDPACPATYSYSYGGKPCSPIGLNCAYPGAGDGESNGCYATAELWCRGDAGAGGGGADGGTGTWVFGQ